MNLIETPMECDKCGKKVGLLSEMFNGVSHTLSQTFTCMDCLPQSLEDAEKRKYNLTEIKRMRKWMDEK